MFSFENYHGTGPDQEYGQDNHLHIGEMVMQYPIQINVRHDASHPRQSRAICEVWNADTLTWNAISTLMPEEVHNCYEAADELRARAAALLLPED